VDTLFVALRVIVSLGVVVGLLWMVQRRVTKGSKRVRANKLVNVVTRQGIAQKASVVVVDMGGQRFLLGVTEHSVTVLSSADVPVPEALEGPVPEALEGPVPEALEGATTKVASRTSATGPVSATGATGFAAALTAAKKNPLPTNFTGFDPKTGQPRRGALDGSIISPATWRRAASALRSSSK
jgi:flagellar protein FliO/FliZ